MRKIMIVQYRRKREGKTNYKKRLTLLKSNKLRLVVRRSLRNINVQVMRYEHDGDKVVVSANSRELKKYGWENARSNLPAAYLVGLLCGLKAKKQKVKDLVLDAGLQKLIKGNMVYGALKGFVDAGTEVAFGEGIFPTEERIQGKHISDKVVKDFEKVKSSILKGAM